MLKKSEKYLGTLFIFFFTFLLTITLAKAACSIGANPLSMGARAIPGQTVIATWNLYNLYGDRTTHVKVDLMEGPDWEITYEPALHEATYNITGVIQTIDENVALEQSSVVAVKPETIPEGMDYVKHPNEEGYIQVKTVNIYIKVPDDAELWKDHKFVFEALGNCFMEPGAVVPAIATQLEVSVKTIAGEFYEEVIEELPEEKRAGIVGMAIKGLQEQPIVGILVAVILILVIFIIILITRKKKQKR